MEPVLKMNYKMKHNNHLITHSKCCNHLSTLIYLLSLLESYVTKKQLQRRVGFLPTLLYSFRVSYLENIIPRNFTAKSRRKLLYLL